jgi:poly(A) polymerase
MISPPRFPAEEQTLLKSTFLFAKQKKIKLYLVGGIIRDIFLGRKKDNLDFDFCLRNSAISFGRNLSRRIKAGFVVLDKEHGACRLVKRIRNKTCTLDFTDFRGKTLQEDLLHRDFTIDAMALEPEKLFFGLDLSNSLIDPYGGRRDLKEQIIRVVNKKSFFEDPLRILRAFSFSALLGFRIDKETLQLAKKERENLSAVSGERIRDELFKIFNQPDSFDYLVKLDELKILKIIFPEVIKMRGIGQGPYHHLDVWQHTLETVRQLELLMQELKDNREIQGYLNEVISSERKRKALLKLGAFLHDIGKPAALRREDGKIKFHGHERIGLEMAENISGRLRLSNDELNALKIIVLRHLRPGYLADNEELTPRARFRYFRDTAKEAVSILLLSIADQRATKGPLTTRESRIRQEKVAFCLIKEYFKKNKEKRIRRLINGNDLLKKFKLEPSPLIGKILSEIEELQAIGKVRTKEEALKIAKKFIK